MAGLQKLVRMKNISVKDVEQLFETEKMDNKELKMKIESLTPEYCIVFDPQEKENTEEFEMLPYFEEEEAEVL